MNVFKAQGIIFDLDNTILRSRINFSAMKDDIFQYLVTQDLLHRDFPVADHTTSTILEHVQRTDHWNLALQETVWEILKKHELLGMQHAELEPGAREVLHQLHGQFKMVIMTNNSYAAAMAALIDNRIAPFFDTVIGREQMKFMKPSPDGVFAIFERYPDYTPDDWISVGDAWIDGQASQAAGVRFISYRGDSERMKSKGVVPVASIDDLCTLTHLIKENLWNPQ